MKDVNCQKISPYQVQNHFKKIIKNSNTNEITINFGLENDLYREEKIFPN